MSLSIHSHILDRSLNNNTSNPSIWGHSFLMYPTSNPMLERVMSFPLLPPWGAVIINLVGLILGALMLLGVLKTLVMPPLLEGLILPNKMDMPCLIPINLKWEDTLSVPLKWDKIPNSGCTHMRTTLILECLMVVLI